MSSSKRSHSVVGLQSSGLSRLSSRQSSKKSKRDEQCQSNINQSVSQSIDQPLINYPSVHKIAPIPKDAFTNYVLPYLKIDDLLQLSVSFVCHDWCQWARERFAHVCQFVQLTLQTHDCYEGRDYTLRTIDRNSCEWVQDNPSHANASKDQLVYTGLDESESVTIGSYPHVKFSVLFHSDMFSKPGRYGEGISFDVQILRDAKHVWFFDLDNRIEYTINMINDGEDDEGYDETDDVQPGSLHLSQLQMAQLWWSSLDQMRWIYLAVLTCQLERDQWNELMCFYRKYQRKFSRITHKELIELTQLCTLGRVRKWITHCEELMRQCDHVPLSFWNQALSV